MATRTLLLADDSVTVQRVVAYAMATEDVDVVAVGDGEEAIARITAEPPDLVIADIDMPKRSGYDVAAFVKGRPDLAHIPVLLLAGMFEPADERRVQEVRGDGVLVKPLKPQELVERVGVLLAQAHAPRPSPIEIDQRMPPLPVAGDAGVEEYFNRLDAAFRSVGGVAGRRATNPDSAEPLADDRSQPGPFDIAVPTLHELLAKLPDESRSMLAPGSARAVPADVDVPQQSVDDHEALVEEVTRRVLERLTADPTWVERIVSETSNRIVREEMARRRSD